MQTTQGQFHPTRFQDVAVTVDFHCHSACRFCIVQEGMNRYQGVPLARFAELVAENARSRKYERVIFTGGEVTLARTLPDYVRLARDSGVFTYLRLQTNGRRLADPAFARGIVEEGVNEFFVSIHGHDAASHDDITQRPGSFDELVAGLANLRALGVRVITNTVMTRRNLASIAPIVDVARAHGVARMEFWNYLPMEDQQDERDLIAPVGDLMPRLRDALARCSVYDIDAVTKYVPRCLLGEHAGTLDNSQADVIIVESFWDQFPRFNCLYEAVCEHGGACLGLHHAYVNKFGWEEGALARTPRTSPWVERDELREGTAERYEPAREDSIAHPAWEHLVGAALADPSRAGALKRVQLTRNQARYLLVTREGASVEVVLVARDETSPALARTRSFNVFYTNLSNAETAEAQAAVRDLLGDLVESVRARDEGVLSLDARKGIVQVLPPERLKRRARPGG